MTTGITRWLDRVGIDLSPGASHLLKALCVHCRLEDGLVLDLENAGEIPNLEFFRRVCSLSRSSVVRYRRELLQHGLIQDTGRRGGQTGRVVLYRVTGALCDWDPDVSLKPGNAEERVDASAGDIKPAPWDSLPPGAADYGGGPYYAESNDGDDPTLEPSGNQEVAPEAPCTCGLVCQIMVTMGSCRIHPNIESRALFGTLPAPEPEHLGCQSQDECIVRPATPEQLCGADAPNHLPEGPPEAPETPGAGTSLNAAIDDEETDLDIQDQGWIKASFNQLAHRYFLTGLGGGAHMEHFVMAMQDLLALGADRYVAIDLAREAAGMFLWGLGLTWQRANGPDQRQEYRERVVNVDLLPLGNQTFDSHDVKQARKVLERLLESYSLDNLGAGIELTHYTLAEYGLLALEFNVDVATFVTLERVQLRLETLAARWEEAHPIHNRAVHKERAMLRLEWARDYAHAQEQNG